MDKIIAEQLQIHFKNYKEYLLFILIIFFLLLLLIQFLSNLFLTKKIESFKNELKKGEIKFSKHTEMQIECLKSMYNNVVDLHFCFNRLIDPQYLTHNSLINSINDFYKVFHSNMDYFHRNKILLTEEIINQIGVIHAKFKIIKELCNNHLKSLSDIEEYHMSNEPQTIYHEPENETNEIRKRIESLKADSAIATFEDDLKKLRELVENYFKELTR